MQDGVGGTMKVLSNEEVRTNRTRFKKAVGAAFLEQMKEHPERVSDLVREDVDNFAEELGLHLVEKISGHQLVLINDTVAMACERLEIQPTFEAVYQFLGSEKPTMLVGIHGC